MTQAHTIVTRFAPTPTGFLHMGHAHAALIAYRRAREARGQAQGEPQTGAGGRFLLRIENIDATRCRPEFEAAIMDDMAWLGIVPDGPIRRQSEHLADYAAVLDELRARDLLYPCFCTRAEIARSGVAPHGPDGPVYPGTCSHLSPERAAARMAMGEAHCWRLRTQRALGAVGPLHYEEEGVGPVACDPLVFGDVVLARKDCPGSYHLCVTHDDWLQGITLVTRGEELRAVTDIHRLLQAVMGWPAPRYAHHALLRDASGAKLSKRDGALSLRRLRDEGFTPEAVLRPP